LVLQIDSQIDDHDYIITPCLLLRTEGTQFSMYVVLKIEEEKIRIFDYDKKEYSISADEFQDLLRGSIIILKEKETYNPPKKVLKEYQEEQAKNKEYINNIRVIDDFISEKECKNIIDFCEESNLFQRSKTVGSKGTMVSDHRTSSSAMMEIDQNPQVISNVKEKIAAFLGCNSNKIEEIQTVRYYKSEGFKPHFDAYIKKRKLTCLLYLNEDFLGGETYFPEVDFGVTPKIGRLLIFQNLNEQSKVITESFHQGSPILDGVKYACNIWIEV
jgi:predicted 2-oxoglutarate/Fe(II)-dependent dioxygenase YbiX